MTVHQLCQAIQDEQGYLVAWDIKQRNVGEVLEFAYWEERTWSPRFHICKVAIVGPATFEDMKRQHDKYEQLGILWDPADYAGRYFHKVVAE